MIENIISADPGLSGACAIFNKEKLVQIFDMPVCSIVRNGKKRSDISYISLSFLIRNLTPGSAVVEKVSSMKAQGISSAFAFGKATGAILGALGVLGWDIEEISPQRWKKYFNLTGKAKDESRVLALELFPEHKNYFKRKKDNGRSDAALLGLYFIKNGKPLGKSERQLRSIKERG